MASRVNEMGETTLLPFHYDLDDVKVYEGLFRLLNKLDIPYKDCWTTISRDRHAACVVYHHTDMNF